MKKIPFICILIISVLAISACSDGSHYRGEYAEEKRAEARIEEETYKYELRKELYEEAYDEIMYQLEGQLKNDRGVYVNVDDLIQIMKRQLGDDEMAEDLIDTIVSHPDLNFVTMYDIYENLFKSSSND